MQVEVEYLYELVREGRIDAYDVDLTKLVKAFKEKAESLKGEEVLPLAGRFLLASVKIMKLKLEYF
ncbi:MAG: segregation/condensation protein A, partial [Hydrogenobacter sp.]